MAPQPIVNNGDARLNGPALALVFVATLLLLYKLGRYYQLLPYIRFPQYVESGWSTVALSFVSTVLMVISLTAAQDRTRREPSDWAFQMFGLAGSLFLGSLLCMLGSLFFGH